MKFGNRELEITMVHLITAVTFSTIGSSVYDNKSVLQIQEDIQYLRKL